MATKFTPINQRKNAVDTRHVRSESPKVPPGSPPMSPLSPPPSWFNDEDMECPHTPTRKQSASVLAPSTSSNPRLESHHLERSSPSPLFVGQALAPSTLLFPHLPVLALQKNAPLTARKRDSEELGTEEVEHGGKATRRKAQKTSTQDEEKDRQCYRSDEADYVKRCPISRLAKAAFNLARALLVAYWSI